MIRIVRSPNPPEVLLVNGAARRRAHQADIDANPGAFSSRTERLTFDREIYGHRSVKDELIAMQHGKCAYCEAKPLPVSDGDVEHFRPKGAVRQAEGEPVQRPGYYWLAYDWTNLLFACERCNRRHKESLFPLTDPTRRARSSRDHTAHEAPVFIDPSAEDPEQYIGYRDHVPMAIDGNIRGQRTIAALGLQRPDLSADREEHLEHVKTLHAAVSLPDVPDKLRARARVLLAKAIRVDAKFSLMCRAAIRDAEAANASLEVRNPTDLHSPA